MKNAEAHLVLEYDGIITSGKLQIDDSFQFRLRSKKF